MPVTPTPQQYPQWEFDLLSALGAPASVNNLTALNLWAQSEGNVINNPLATSGQGAGASTCVAQCGSSSPIYEYATEADGVAQMAHFLGGSYYTAIVRAFQQDAGLAAIYQAVNNSPWCKGCQNGSYPVDLAAAVGGKAGAISSGVGGGSGKTGTAQAAPAPAAGSGLSQCVIQFPGFLFFSGPCLLTKGGVKWLSGVAALLGGGALIGFGVVLLAAWGFDASGAKQAVGKATRAVGIPAALVTGQPEIAAGLKVTAPRGNRAPRGQSSPAKRTNSAAGTQQTPDIPTVGRIRSAGIERRFRAAERQQGPIGPRGGSATSRRVAFEQRRGTSYAAAGRRRTPEQVARARQRAREPF